MERYYLPTELCCTISSYLTVEQGIDNYTFQEIICDSMLRKITIILIVSGELQNFGFFLMIITFVDS